MPEPDVIPTRRREAPYAIATRDLLCDRRLTHALKVVYLTMQTYADRDGVCWPSMTKLASDLGCSTSAVAQNITALERAGFLQVLRESGPNGARGRNRYRLQIPPPAVDGTPDGTPELLSSPKKPLLSSPKNPPLSSAKKGVLSPAKQGTKPGLTEVLSRAKNNSTSRTRPVEPDQSQLDHSETSSPAGKRKNRVAQVIDALRTLGNTDPLSGRDMSAITKSTADPALLAEAYVALRAGQWGDAFLQKIMTLYTVVDRLPVYLAWREAHDSTNDRPIARAGGQLADADPGRAGPAEDAGPARYDYVDNADYTGPRVRFDAEGPYREGPHGERIPVTLTDVCGDDAPRLRNPRAPGGREGGRA